MTVQITITHDEPESQMEIVVVDTYNKDTHVIAPGEKRTTYLHSQVNLVVSERPVN